MMKIVILCSLFLVQVFASTTKHHLHTGHHHTGHHTGPTKEPAEHETLLFRYDPHSHMLLTMIGHKCYVYQLSGDQTTDVHTAHGLHTLEMSMITLIDDKTATYTAISLHDLTVASKQLSHTCHAARFIYKLN